MTRWGDWEEANSLNFTMISEPKLSCSCKDCGAIFNASDEKKLKAKRIKHCRLHYSEELWKNQILERAGLPQDTHSERGRTILEGLQKSIAPMLYNFLLDRMKERLAEAHTASQKRDLTWRLSLKWESAYDHDKRLYEALAAEILTLAYPEFVDDDKQQIPQ